MTDPMARYEHKPIPEWHHKMREICQTSEAAIAASEREIAWFYAQVIAELLPLAFADIFQSEQLLDGIRWLVPHSGERYTKHPIAILMSGVWLTPDYEHTKEFKLCSRVKDRIAEVYECYKTTFAPLIESAITITPTGIEIEEREWNQQALP